jgi:hypothetical protein
MVVVSQLQLKGAWGICGLITVLGAGLLTMIEMERRRHFNLHLTAVFGTVWIVVAGVFTWIMPEHNNYRHQTELARRINGQLPADAAVYLVEIPENQIAFYLDRPFRRHDQSDEFTAALPPKKSGRYYIVGPERLAETLRAAGEVTVIDRCESIIRWMKPDDRLTCFQFESSPAKIAAERGDARR